MINREKDILVSGYAVVTETSHVKNNLENGWTKIFRTDFLRFQSPYFGKHGHLKCERMFHIE